MEFKEFIIEKSGKSGSWERIIKSKYPIIYNDILNIDAVSSFKEKLYLYMNPLCEYRCKKCNKPTKVHRLKDGFMKYCSPQCRGRIPSKKTNVIIPKKYNDISDKPTLDIILSFINDIGFNYMASKIRKKYTDFYYWLMSDDKIYGKSFNEKLFNYFKIDEPICKNCGSKKVKFNTYPNWHYNPFCSKQCANTYNKKYMTGGYNHRYFEQYPQYKSKSCNLYLLRLYNENENFLKIGITVENINRRKNGICGAKYKMEIIRMIKTTLYDAHIKEVDVLKTYTKQKYKPQYVKSGKTECFPIELQERICKMI